MKLYGLRYLKDEGSLWSDFYAFSHERDELTTLCKHTSGWYLGTSDAVNNSKEICYTDKNKYPRYSIVEVPFVV